MTTRYFKMAKVGTVLAVSDKVAVGEGENAKLLIHQYESRPDYYIPCDKNGKPLSAKAKSPTTKSRKPSNTQEADAETDKATDAQTDDKPEEGRNEK